MRVTLEDYTDNPEREIARYASICYGSPCDPASLDRRIKNLMKVKHLATLRFASATFFVEGVSRVTTHQLVRHPHLSYLQESQRYVDQRGADFVVPDSVDDVSRTHILSIYSGLVEAYDRLIRDGVSKENARYVLPGGATSSMYITGNFQSWFDFLRNRTDPHAQAEIREVATQMAEKLYRVAPNVFGEFVDA